MVMADNKMIQREDPAAEAVSKVTDDFDREHLWHPYTSAVEPLPAFKVVKAEGRTLFLSDGTQLIDAMSSWWCCNLGYQIPEITAALKAQVDTLPHVMFGGLTHEPAIKLGRHLLRLFPEMNHVFYGDSGSVATEIALKLAVHYQKAAGHKERTGFMTFRGGYHGDTWNAMTVSDPEGMHALFEVERLTRGERHFFTVPQVPYPGTEVDPDVVLPDSSEPARTEEEALSLELEHLREQFARYQECSAAVILEPVVQGAGGMRFYHPAYLQELRRLTQEHGILLVFDEIATGFGRTGAMSVKDLTGVCPDVMLLGKGLTAGYMTLSAVLCTKEVAATVPVMMHGPTFMANPLACAVAEAALNRLESLDYQKLVADIEAALKEGLSGLKTRYEGSGMIRSVRVLGAIGVIEFTSPVNVRAVMAQCLNLGVWLRPMGNLLYTMPPVTITKDELTQVISAMKAITEGIISGSITSTRALEDQAV